MSNSDQDDKTAVVQEADAVAKADDTHAEAEVDLAEEGVSSKPSGTETDQRITKAALPSRFMGDLMDFLLVTTLAGAIFDGILDPNTAGETAKVGVLVYAVFGIYEVVCVTVWGKTLGRKAAGVAVRSLENPGRRINVLRSIERWALKTFTPLLCVALLASEVERLFTTIYQIGVLAVIVSIYMAADRRGFHDKVAGIMVVAEARSKKAEPEVV